MPVYKTIILSKKNPPNWPNVIFKCKKLVSDFTAKLPVQNNQKILLLLLLIHIQCFYHKVTCQKHFLKLVFLQNFWCCISVNYSNYNTIVVIFWIFMAETQPKYYCWDLTLWTGCESRAWVTVGSFEVGGWCPACRKRGRENGGEFGQTSDVQWTNSEPTTHPVYIYALYSLLQVKVCTILPLQSSLQWPTS